MTALLVVLAAVLGAVPTVLLALAIPRLGDLPDQPTES